MIVLKESVEPPEWTPPGVTFDIPTAEDYPTEQDIRELLERRLRVAGLYSESVTRTMLGVGVESRISSMGTRWVVSFSYFKRFTIPITQSSITACLHTRGTTTACLWGQNQIMEALSTYTDEFLEDFLRVNKEACEVNGR